MRRAEYFDFDIVDLHQSGRLDTRNLQLFLRGRSLKVFR